MPKPYLTVGPPRYFNSLIRAPRIITGSLLRLRCWNPMCPFRGRSLTGGASVPSCRFTGWSNVAQVHVLHHLAVDRRLQPSPFSSMRNVFHSVGLYTCFVGAIAR